MENMPREALSDVVRQFQNAHNRILYQVMQEELAQEREPMEPALAEGLLKSYPTMSPEVAEAEAGRYLDVMREFYGRVVEAALVLEAEEAEQEGRLRLQRAEIFRNHFIDDVAVQRQSGSEVVEDLPAYIPAIHDREYYLANFLTERFRAGAKTSWDLMDDVLACDRSVAADCAWEEAHHFLEDVRHYAALIRPAREI